MKIRNGFVSNSSSSSFVILGVKQKNEFYTDDKNKDDVTGLESLYVEFDDCDYIVGTIISDDEYLEDSKTTFTELQEMAKNISEKLNVDISEVELITGTRPC